ncbi:hypothetical protein D3C81_1084570 [compost metagenome]
MIQIPFDLILDQQVGLADLVFFLTHSGEIARQSFKIVQSCLIDVQIEADLLAFRIPTKAAAFGKKHLLGQVVCDDLIFLGGKAAQCFFLDFNLSPDLIQLPLRSLFFLLIRYFLNRSGNHILLIIFVFDEFIIFQGNDLIFGILQKLLLHLLEDAVKCRVV